ncbi:zinc finger protein 62 homolog [Artemia franciscana]|uniref:zinc finger protein 62 homolog n=1 Tax=Artemia franciscana TaxID=6661 RepID=UPI0032DB2FCE
MSVGESCINISEEPEAISITDEQEKENEDNNGFATESRGNVKAYKCKICSKTFCRKYDLERHISLSRNVNEWPYVCEICTRGFGYLDRLRNHRASVHGLDAKPVHCEICNHESVTQDHHRYHIKVKHWRHWSIMKKYHTEDITIQATFETDTNVDENHLFSNEKSDEISKLRIEISENPSFPSERTESNVVGNFSMTSKMDVSPLSQDQESCISIDEESQLVSNVDEKRDGSVSGQCSKNLKKLQKAEFLTDNNRVHTNTCEICYKVFPRKRDLEMHVSDCHSMPVDLPYTCEIFGKNVCYPQRLRGHQASAHGIDVRPIICGMCKHKSITQESLSSRYHMKVKRCREDTSKTENSKDLLFLQVFEDENDYSADEEPSNTLKLSDDLSGKKISFSNRKSDSDGDNNSTKANTVDYFDLSNAIEISLSSQDQEKHTTIPEESESLDRNQKHKENLSDNSPDGSDDQIIEGLLFKERKTEANTREICSKVFMRKRDFDKHNYECHNKPPESPCACDICGKNLYYPKRLRNHRASVHGIEIKPVICEICSHESVTQDHHAYHIKSRHCGQSILNKNGNEDFGNWQVSEANNKVDVNHQFTNKESRGISKLPDDLTRVNVCLSNRKADPLFTEFRKSNKSNAVKVIVSSSFQDQEISTSLTREPIVRDIGEKIRARKNFLAIAQGLFMYLRKQSCRSRLPKSKQILVKSVAKHFGGNAILMSTTLSATIFKLNCLMCVRFMAKICTIEKD